MMQLSINEGAARKSSTERLWKRFIGIAIEEINILEDEINELLKENEQLKNDIEQLEEDKRKLLTTVADSMSDEFLERSIMEESEVMQS